MKTSKLYIAPRCHIITIHLQQIMVTSPGDREIENGSQDGVVHDDEDDMPGGGSAAPRWHDLDFDLEGDL